MSTSTTNRHDSPPLERSDEPHREVNGLRRLSAEVVGTYFLVIAAAGTDMAADLHPGELPLAVRAVAPALVVAAMIYSLGAVSGAAGCRRTSQQSWREPLPRPPRFR